MTILQRLISMFFLLALAACGGGGGSAGTSVLGGGGGSGSGAATALFTTAPSSLTLAVGSTSAQFSISGGTPGYSVATSNAAVATVQASGTTFTINAVSGGSAVVSIKDSIGGEVTVNVATAASGVALFSTAPAGVTVAVGGTTQSYLISGGSPAYSVISSDAAVASVGVNDSQFVVNGVSGGTATVTIKDSAGAGTTVAVTVGSATKLFTTAASSVTIVSGSSQTYAISGGAAPYTASSSNGGLTSATVSGSVLTITGIASGSASVVVLDGAGSSVQIAVVVSSSGTGVSAALFTSASASIVVAPTTRPTYLIGGGTGPYTVSSSNTTVASASVSGSTTLAVTGVGAGSATLVVSDALGAKVTVNVVVGTAQVVALYTTAPASATLAAGSSQTYAIGGGVAPYAVTTSNPVLATVSVTGSTFTVSAATGGNAQISVFDSTGGSVSFAVAVPVGGALFTTAPAIVAVAINRALNYTIGGGTAPYVATSSNVSFATASVSGATLTLSGLSTGSAQVVVRDAAGAQLTISANVAAANLLATSAPSAITIAPASAATYQISGGVGPYFASSTNLTAASGAVSGSTLTIAAVASASTSVVVRDSAGNSVSIAVTVSPVPPLYTSAQSSVTMAKGASPIYFIGGGTAGYSASSSNASVATASVSANSLTINGVSNGTANVLLLDAVGNTVTIAVTVGPSIALFSSAPASITILPSGTQSYTLGGGSAPYFVASSNSGFATASASGSTLTVTGVAAGSVSVVVTDAVGVSLTVAVTVTPAASIPLAVTPLSVSASVGDVLTFTVIGGNAPYTVTVNNSTVAQASVSSVGASGGTFTTNLLNAGATTVAVIDSKGQTQTISLTVTQVQPLLRLSPSSVAISELDSQVVVMNIFGGVAPYKVYTSDTNLSSVTVSGTAVSVGLGANGNRCITSSTFGYLAPISNSKIFGDWTVNFGTVGVIITVVDSTGRSSNGALIIVDNATTCP
jgi:hypothetical protein